MANAAAAWDESSIVLPAVEQQLHEHQEFSLMETRPDGRTFSLSVSISTPARRPRTGYHSLVATSALRTSSVLPSLSPLSNFSLRQDDSRHLKARNLSQQSTKLLLPRQPGHLTSAQTTQNLIAILTDAEPDEPFWDWMASLNMESKNLDSLHMLEEFCPRLEELNVCQNGLMQLEGAPASIRALSISHNAISSLTHWGAFGNLQYLDVSHNNIESLEGFGNLVHLRELNADHNQIATLDAILDLDALISLSLQSNELTAVDCHDTGLRRLMALNLSDNKIGHADGFEFLPRLRSLDLSRNRLTRFGHPRHSSLHATGLYYLNVNDNTLSSLDISSLPRMHCFEADRNELCFVEGILEHRRLRKVYLLHSTFTFEEARNGSAATGRLIHGPSTTTSCNGLACAKSTWFRIERQLHQGPEASFRHTGP